MLKRWFKKILGFFLILLGTAGLVLPFLPGVLMIFAGFALLGNARAEKSLEQVQLWWQQKWKKICRKG